MVLGSGRSGTSVTAQLLSGLGGTLSDILTLPDETNPLGPSEDKEVFDTHRRLMREFGFSQYTTRPSDWRKNVRYTAAIEEIGKIVEERHRTISGHWVLKDPNLCYFLPIWRRVLRKLKIIPKYVYCVRDPQAVVGSLKFHYGDKETNAEWFWLLKNLYCISETTADFYLAHYERLLKSPVREIEGLARFCELESEDSSKIKALATDIVRVSSDRSSGRAENLVLPATQHLYALLKEGRGEKYPAAKLRTAALSHLEALEQFAILHRDTPAPDRAKAGSRKPRDENTQLESLKKQIEDQESQYRDLESNLHLASESLERLTHENEDFKKAQSLLESEDRTLERQIVDLQQELSALRTQIPKANAESQILREQSSKLLDVDDRLAEDLRNRQKHLDSVIEERGRLAAENQTLSDKLNALMSSHLEEKTRLTVENQTLAEKLETSRSDHAHELADISSRLEISVTDFERIREEKEENATASKKRISQLVDSQESELHVLTGFWHEQLANLHQSTLNSLSSTHSEIQSLDSELEELVSGFRFCGSEFPPSVPPIVIENQLLLRRINEIRNQSTTLRREHSPAGPANPTKVLRKRMQACSDFFNCRYSESYLLGETLHKCLENPRRILIFPFRVFRIATARLTKRGELVRLRGTRKAYTKTVREWREAAEAIRKSVRFSLGHSLLLCLRSPIRGVPEFLGTVRKGRSDLRRQARLGRSK